MHIAHGISSFQIITEPNFGLTEMHEMMYLSRHTYTIGTDSVDSNIMGFFDFRLFLHMMTFSEVILLWSMSFSLQNDIKIQCTTNFNIEMYKINLKIASQSRKVKQIEVSISNFLFIQLIHLKVLNIIRSVNYRTTCNELYPTLQ